MSVKKSVKKGGRPAAVLTKEQIAEVEKLAETMTVEQIAGQLGIGERTFYEIKNRDAAVSTAYKKGKSKAIHFVASQLMSKIKEGDVTSIIFFLKTRAGWSENMSEKEQIEQPTPDFVFEFVNENAAKC